MILIFQYYTIFTKMEMASDVHSTNDIVHIATNSTNRHVFIIVPNISVTIVVRYNNQDKFKIKQNSQKLPAVI